MVLLMAHMIRTSSSLLLSPCCPKRGEVHYCETGHDRLMRESSLCSTRTGRPFGPDKFYSIVENSTG